MDNKGFLKISIDELLNSKREIAFDIFIRLSDDKVVKLAKGEDSKAVLPKYKEKGIEGVYVVRGEYEEFLASFKKRLAEKFYNPATTRSEQFDLLSNSYLAAKESFLKLGVSPQALLMAEDVSKKGIEFVSKTQSIFSFYLEFKKNCAEEFLTRISVSYITSLMASTFDWQTTAIKEKMSLACMICDMTLTQEDFLIMKEKNYKHAEYPEKIKNHALLIAETLKSSKMNVGHEILHMLEQHHEKPDGSGYPRGLRQSAISMLAAIEIVAEEYIEQMMKCEFDKKKNMDVLSKIMNRYNQGNFKKASIALCQVFGVSVPTLV